MAPRINSYVLQQERIAQKLALAKTIQRVPPELQPRQHAPYPPDNAHEFERWFKDTTTPHELTGKPRTYLPILWTAYWCNNGYGKREKHKRMMQRYVDSLPRNKAYFSICQYDDGPMVDFKDLDIKIFGMSGGRIDYPIPLLCMPHKYEFPGIKKDIFCSFVGGDTHPIRRELINEFYGKSDCYISFIKHSLEDYCRILARSIYVLCPRGYGKSSFRIMEAIHYDAKPIYISDEFITPYYDEHLIKIRIHTTLGLYDSLNNIPDTYPKNHTNDIKPLFTYEGCKQKILENI